MQSIRADLALLGLAVVGVAADLACILTGHTPPGLFDQVVIAGIAGGAGIAIQPSGGQAPAEPAPAPVAQAPAPAAAQLGVQAVPVPYQVPQQPAAVTPYTGPVGQ